jgi:hypothetical protein
MCWKNNNGGSQFIIEKKLETKSNFSVNENLGKKLNNKYYSNPPYM